MPKFNGQLMWCESKINSRSFVISSQRYRSNNKKPNVFVVFMCDFTCIQDNSIEELNRSEEIHVFNRFSLLQGAREQSCTKHMPIANQNSTSKSFDSTTDSDNLGIYFYFLHFFSFCPLLQ